MVLKEWGEIRQLYKDCMPPPYKTLYAMRPAWVSLCAWVIANLVMLFLLMYFMEIVGVLILGQGIPPFQSHYTYSAL